MRLSRLSGLQRFVLVLGIAAVAGCQASPEQQVKDAFRNEFRENGRRVAVMYARYMSSPTKPVTGRDGFAGPADEAELRRFIAATPSAALEEIGIKSAESAELFASERDGQPFRVRYGIKGPLSTTYAVLCETKGVNGRVKVFKSDGAFVEVPADEADAHMAGKHDVAYDPTASTL
ncbi:MAG: hypothetical protein RLZZ111_657 [Planctomycetota bacterium]|jgi:hypothetical protein